MADTVVQELIVNTLTQAQFDAAKAAGKLSPYELYGTPDTSADRDLMNTTDNVDFVIESQLPTAENNYTWYRKYKSGWVEQGGVFTAPSGKSSISLPIVMAGDLNYYKPDAQAIVSASDARNVQILDTSSATTLGIITNNSFKVCWRVVGQSA